MSQASRQTILDASGLQCPLPVLKARKLLQSMESGDQIVLVATDPMSVIDVAHFCREQGHHLMRQDDEDGVFRFTIERA